MTLVGRYLVAGFGLMAGLVWWWFPAPWLVRLEPVDWAARHERKFTPPERIWGVMEMGRAFIQSVTEPVPLTEFIAHETRNALIPVSGPEWERVFAEPGLPPAPEGGGPAGIRYVSPSDPPFTGLDRERRFLEWRDAKGIRQLEYRFIPADEFGNHPIPPEARYPFRHYWPVAAPALLFVMFWGFFWPGASGPVAASSAARGARGSALFLALSSGLVLWPFVHGTVGSGLSFASILIGGLLVIGGAVALWLFGVQVAMVRRLIDGRAYLAHFTFPREEWNRFVDWNYRSELSEKKALWWLIFIISLIVGLGFVAVMRDKASVWVFGFLMGFMVFLRFLAVGLPRLTARRQREGIGGVYVGREGACLNGVVHSWITFGARLESAEYADDPLPHVLVVYSQLQSSGRALYFYRQDIPLRIPVPAGRESEGRELARSLNAAGRRGTPSPSR